MPQCGSHGKESSSSKETDKQRWCASLFSKHKVTLVCFFKVTVSERVTGLIKGYWLCAANREPVHREKKQSFVRLGSREVSALAEDQTKGAIDTGTFTLTVPGGEQCWFGLMVIVTFLLGATKRVLFK